MQAIKDIKDYNQKLVELADLLAKKHKVTDFNGFYRYVCKKYNEDNDYKLIVLENSALFERMTRSNYQIWEEIKTKELQEAFKEHKKDVNALIAEELDIADSDT